MRRRVSYFTKEKLYEFSSTGKPKTPNKLPIDSSSSSQHLTGEGTSLKPDENMQDTRTEVSQFKLNIKETESPNQTIDLASQIGQQQDQFNEPEDLLNSSLAQIDQAM